MKHKLAQITKNFQRVSVSPTLLLKVNKAAFSFTKIQHYSTTQLADTNRTFNAKYMPKVSFYSLFTQPFNIFTLTQSQSMFHMIAFVSAIFVNISVAENRAPIFSGRIEGSSFDAR